MQISASRARPICVSIVSHGHGPLLRVLLEQLDAYSAPIIEKVVLTVNIPEANALIDLRLRFPLEIVRNESPKGFGANHNGAFLRCSQPWFLVLNPDIRLESDVLSPLVMGAKTVSGLVAPRIVEPGKVRPENHRALITPYEILARRRSIYRSPVEPSWVPGMFMLFRSEAFAAINGFDRRFFMYGEDFDICARTQLADWQLQVFENLTVLHDARRASHTSFKHLYWHVTSLAKVWLSGTFWKYRAWTTALKR